MTLRVLLVAALMLFHGEVQAEPLREIAGVSPTLIIYLRLAPLQSRGAARNAVLRSHFRSCAMSAATAETVN